MKRKEFLTGNAALFQSAFFIPNNVLSGSVSGNSPFETLTLFSKKPGAWI